VVRGAAAEVNATDGRDGSGYTASPNRRTTRTANSVEHAVKTLSRPQVRCAYTRVIVIIIIFIVIMIIIKVVIIKPLIPVA
jgi:t-SNARE complex subunit (syntaxin)